MHKVYINVRLYIKNFASKFIETKFLFVIPLYTKNCVFIFKHIIYSINLTVDSVAAYLKFRCNTPEGTSYKLLYRNPLSILDFLSVNSIYITFLFQCISDYFSMNYIILLYSLFSICQL